MSYNTFTITLGRPTNNGKPCSKPVVEYAGSGDLLIECIDKGRNTYKVTGDTDDNKCLTFIVSCEDCDACGRIEITKCLCTTGAECGDCEECIGSICTSTCTEDEKCLDGTCAECSPTVPCPDGRVCKNGKCLCPTTAPFLVDGKCLECIGDVTANCQTCIGGKLVAIPCSGACDPTTNQCVGCLQASDCDGENECCVGKACTCCPGYTRNPQSGVCEPTPECGQDSDCGSCGTCLEGECRPVLCPSGQICVNGDCVEECDCAGGDPCSEATKRCVPGAEGCGCIPCQGDCATGCGEGCYCNGTECVGNPCANNACSCTDGTDCPDGYGCQNGNCVPCVAQDCATQECGNTLGCACSGTTCVDADTPCGNTPCTTGADCGPGCTCHEGRCVSCANFPCSDCGTHAGCGCTSARCAGTDTPCGDTLTLSKLDPTCGLEAELSKTEDCSCAEISLAVLGKKVSSDAARYTYAFEARMYKGPYTPALTFPLLDNTSHPDIAENDSPTTGTVEATLGVTRTKFEVRYNARGEGRRVRVATVPDALKTTTTSYTSGTTAKAAFANIEVPVIGHEEVTNRDSENRPSEITVVRSAYIAFSIVSTVAFPNKCHYREKTALGRHRFNTESDYDVFGLGFGSPLGSSLRSTDMRDPLFKWFKSKTPEIATPPFLKLYVAKDAATDTYKNQYSLRPGEACHYFKVTSDCTCAPDADIYAVFCQPEDFDFELSNCNKTIKYTGPIFVPCPANLETTYYFRAGSVYVTWQGNQWNTIAGRSWTSNVPIETVEYGQVCDTTDECKKTYAVEQSPATDLRVNFITTCRAGATTVDVQLPDVSLPSDTGFTCAVDRYVVAGAEHAPSSTLSLAPGLYTAKIYFQCGCDPVGQEFEVKCCEVDIPMISRSCTSPTAQCVQIPGATYTVASGPEQGNVLTDVCQYINTIGRDTSARLTVSRFGCPDKTIEVPNLTYCCQGYTVKAVNVTQTSARLTIGRAAGITDTYTISFGRDADGTELATLDNARTTPGQAVYDLTGLTVGKTYNISVNSNNCGVLNVRLIGASNDVGPTDPNGDPGSNSDTTTPNPDTGTTTGGETPPPVATCDQGLAPEERTVNGRTFLYTPITRTSGCLCVAGAITADVVDVANVGEDRIRLTVGLDVADMPRNITNGILYQIIDNVRTPVDTFFRGQALFGNTYDIETVRRIQTGTQTRAIVAAVAIRTSGPFEPTMSATIIVQYNAADTNNPFEEFTTLDITRDGTLVRRLTAADFAAPDPSFRTDPAYQDMGPFASHRVAELTIPTTCGQTFTIGGISSAPGREDVRLNARSATQRCDAKGQGQSTTSRSSLAGTYSAPAFEERQFIDVQLELRSLRSEDGCEYDPVLNTFRIDVGSTSATPAEVTTLMQPAFGTSARPKVEWLKGGAVVATAYPSGGGAALPDAQYTPATTYTVRAACGCTQEETITTT